MATPADTPPERGTILEVFSCNKQSWNGKLVEFEKVVKGRSGQNMYLVTTIYRPVERVKVPPHNLRRPSILSNIDKDTTPAPSLDELPPERGSILELYDIGSEDYDGMIVEFFKVDEESAGKRYFVKPLNKEIESEGIQVKARCCRRPDIKSLEVRRFFGEISSEYQHQCAVVRYFQRDGLPPVEFKDRSLAEMDFVEKRTKNLLRWDPCCAPVYLLLSVIAADRQSNSNENPCIIDITLHRRGWATLYAYKDIAADSYIHSQKQCFAQSMSACGNHKLAIQHQKILLSDMAQSAETTARELAEERYNLTTFLLRSALAYQDKGFYGKELHICVEVTEHLCSIFRETDTSTSSVKELAANRVKFVMVTFSDVNDKFMEREESKMTGDCDRAAWCAEEMTTERYGAVKRTREMKALWRTALDCIRQIFEACTTDDETIAFLDDDTKSALERTRSKALAEIEIARRQREASSEDRNQDHAQQQNSGSGLDD